MHGFLGLAFRDSDSIGLSVQRSNKKDQVTFQTYPQGHLENNVKKIICPLKILLYKKINAVYPLAFQYIHKILQALTSSGCIFIN